MSLCTRVRWCASVLALILFAAGGAAEARAARSLSDLVRDKTDIFTGEVESVRSFWNDEETLIYTEIQIRVAEALVGSARGEVTIEVLGGRVDDVLLDVVGAARFEPGELVLVLAERGSDGKYRLPDMMASKFGLVANRDGSVAVRSESALDRLVPVDPEARAMRNQMSWDIFRGFLDDAIRGAEVGGWPERLEPVDDLAKGPAPNRGFHVVGPGGLHGGKSLCPNEGEAFAHWDLRLAVSCGKFYEINPNLLASTPNPGQAPLTAAQIAAEIYASSNAWNAVSPAHISLNGSNNSGCVAPTGDSVNCVSWNAPFWPANGLSRAIYAITCLWRDANTGVINEADIVLNNQPDDGMGNPTTYRLTPANLNDPVVCGQPEVGIRALVTHELGHFIGLHHPDQFSNPPGCGDDDPAMETMMYQYYQDACKVNLHQADQDGINFLYTADHGDLDDPPYPTKVVGDDGPSHVFGIYPRFQYEWLGICCGKIDDNPAECDALTAPVYDRYDDGGLLLAECDGDKLEVDHVTFLVGVKTNADVLGRSHQPYTAANPLYINAWFDWNDDGTFQPSEHVIGAAPGSFLVTRPGIYGFRLNPPEDTPCMVSHRLRLDYREDVGQVMTAVDPRLNLEKWAARHGEVEDYVGPYGEFNTHPNRPQGPEGKSLPVGSPFYCHIGGMTVTFSDGSSADVDGFCHPPKPWVTGGGVPHPGVLFPDTAGSECMDSTLSFNLDIDSDGVIDESLGLAGPVCVTRSAPYFDDTGLKVIDTEMVSLEMTGHSQYAGEITVRLADGYKSSGRIQQSELAVEMGVDVSIDAPAESYFDIHWVMESSKLGTSEVLGPVRAEAQIASVPPGEPNGQVPGEEVPTEEVPPVEEEPGEDQEDQDLPGDGGTDADLPVVSTRPGS